MKTVSPVKVIDEELTKYHFKKANFYCLRCGASSVVIKDNIKFFAERNNNYNNNHLPRSKRPPVIQVDTTFIVTASLYCIRCKHTYFVKIFDEGIK